MTPRHCFRLATAIQTIAVSAHPVDDQNFYPNAEIALLMGKIAGLGHRVKTICIDLDPSIRGDHSDPKTS